MIIYSRANPTEQERLRGWPLWLENRDSEAFNEASTVQKRWNNRIYSDSGSYTFCHITCGPSRDLSMSSDFWPSVRLLLLTFIRVFSITRLYVLNSHTSTVIYSENFSSRWRFVTMPNHKLESYYYHLPCSYLVRPRLFILEYISFSYAPWQLVSCRELCSECRYVSRSPASYVLAHSSELNCIRMPKSPQYFILDLCRYSSKYKCLIFTLFIESLPGSSDFAFVKVRMRKHVMMLLTYSL